jgi:predicted permease
MSTIREWLRRIWGTFHETSTDANMEEELRLHLEMVADEWRRRGLSPEAAARQARLQVGGIAQAMEEYRDQRGFPWLDNFVQDVRYAARTLRRAPAFAAFAVVTLTLAIGANTAIFSLADALLFRDLPVRDPGSLVQFSWRYPGDPPLNLFSLESYEQYRHGNTAFSNMVGLLPLVTESSVGSEPISADVVTGNFFQMLGVPSALGRMLNASDDAPGSAPTAVVSWQYWQSHFNSDSQALGAIVDVVDRRLPGPVRATIVGVADATFSGVITGQQPDVWLSLGAIPAAMRSVPGFALMARLKPGASIAQARAEMRVLDQPRIDGLAVRDPQWRQVTIDVRPARAGLATPLTDQFGGPLSLLMATVGILLLLACANLSGMLLARGAARQHEMAVRVSLGAGRSRIVRQVLTESLLLAVFGGTLGLAVAPVGAGLLLRTVTSGVRSLAATPHIHATLNVRALLFTASVTMGAAALFGLWPAVVAFRPTLIRVLRTGGPGTPPPSRRTFSGALVVAQITLSLLLVSVGGLYVTHLATLRDHSLGFDRHNVLLMSVTPAASDGTDRETRRSQYAEALMRLRAIPGVRSVAASGMTPVSGAAGSRFVRVDGGDEVPDRRRLSVNTITPDYFATYGTPIVSGRDFQDSDAIHPRRVIVNQAMAARYFAGRNPIGQRIWFDDDREPFEIVGLAGDAKYQDVRVPAPPTVYVYTTTFTGTGSVDLSLRTAISPTAIATDARRVMTDVFGARAVRGVTTLDAQVDASIVPERLMATLSAFFGLVGALLATLGLYGLLAYTVTRRTREIGIRMALGATRSQILRVVLTDALRLVALGVTIGIPLALWGNRFAATMVEHLSFNGVRTTAIAAAGMIVVAIVAAYVPARRAARVEPVDALRLE